jgi:lysyl-tRNA synthetase class 1
MAEEKRISPGKEEAEVTAWADNVAEEVLKRRRKVYVFEGMWTPSGFFHIGNARPEIFTPYSVKRALTSTGRQARQNFILDDFDAVRKIPQGLDIKRDHNDFIGFPCATAPSPVEGFKSWADYFVSNVKKHIKEFGVDLNIVSAFKTYKEGKFNDLIKFALENSAQLTAVWNRVAGAEKPLDFVPLQVLCEKCKKIYYTQVTGWDKAKELVSYKCQCGHEAQVSPYDGNAKLHWRVHWVAHWVLNKVDFESGGKDHFSKGGSVDVGQAMMKEVFKQEPPVQIPTEFIQVGGKKMAGSVGNVVNLGTWLEVASPEMFRFLNFAYKPNSVIDFSLEDNSFILLNDRFERAERIFYGLEKAENEKIGQKIKRAYELSLIKPPAKRLVQVPFSFCIMLSQLFDPEKELAKALSILEQTGHSPKNISLDEKKAVQLKLSRVKNWLDNYAPERHKIKFLEKLTPEIQGQLSSEAKKALRVLAKELPNRKSADQIQELVFFTCQELNLPTKKAFQALYLVLLGKNFGPRIGSLILAFGLDKVVKRLKEVA